MTTNQKPIVTLPQQIKSPKAWAAKTGEVVMSTIIIIFWLLVASAGIAIGYVGFKAVIFFAEIATKSLGGS